MPRDSYQSSIPHHFINAYGSDPDVLSRRPTEQQWNTLMPELIRLKNNDHSNMALLQAMLDEGYRTSLSTLERKLRAFNLQQYQTSSGIEATVLAVDQIPYQSHTVYTLDSENISAHKESDDRTAELYVSTGGENAFSDSGEHGEDSVAVDLLDTSNNDANLEHSHEGSAHDAMSVVSINDTAASLYSDYLRSVHDSCDRTIETESNCPSMFGTMLQTGKRAKRNLAVMTKDALKPRLPPSAPSSGQKVEDWDHDLPYYLRPKPPSQRLAQLVELCMI